MNRLTGQVFPLGVRIEDEPNSFVFPGCSLSKLVVGAPVTMTEGTILVQNSVLQTFAS